MPDLVDEYIEKLAEALQQRDHHKQRASDLTQALVYEQRVNADLLAALEALVGWQDKLSLSDRHATADQARAWSLDCRNARAEVAKAKGIKE